MVLLPPKKAKDTPRDPFSFEVLNRLPLAESPRWKKAGNKKCRPAKAKAKRSGPTLRFTRSSSKPRNNARTRLLPTRGDESCKAVRWPSHWEKTGKHWASRTIPHSHQTGAVRKSRCRPSGERACFLVRIPPYLSLCATGPFGPEAASLMGNRGRFRGPVTPTGKSFGPRSGPERPNGTSSDRGQGFVSHTFGNRAPGHR